MKSPFVLLVEDNEPLLEIMQDILEAEGYGVMAAPDATQALRFLERASPDLIVSDIMMPGLNGYEFYARTQAHPQWAVIPFIFLTARADKRDMLMNQAPGVQDVITKPFRRRELLQAVRERLGQANHASPSNSSMEPV
jgi:CheY-like chemotaxis protein